MHLKLFEKHIKNELCLLYYSLHLHFKNVMFGFKIKFFGCKSSDAYLSPHLSWFTPIERFLQQIKNEKQMQKYIKNNSIKLDKNFLIDNVSKEHLFSIIFVKENKDGCNDVFNGYCEPYHKFRCNRCQNVSWLGKCARV